MAFDLAFYAGVAVVLRQAGIRRRRSFGPLPFGREWQYYSFLGRSSCGLQRSGSFTAARFTRRLAHGIDDAAKRWCIASMRFARRSCRARRRA